jgi:hypothetical protein
MRPSLSVRHRAAWKDAAAVASPPFPVNRPATAR